MENVSLLAAFFAGILGFLSPCVLPIIPGYIAYISGISLGSTQESKGIDWKVVASAVSFVIGFSIVFTLMGAASTAVGSFLQEYKWIISKIAAIVVIILGIHFTGILQSNYAKKVLLGFTALTLILYGYEVFTTKELFGNMFFLFILAVAVDIFYFSGFYKLLYIQKTTEIQKKPPGIVGAFLVGVAFAFGWTPCIGPILGAILLMASQQETVMQGTMLLFAFSLGLGIPFIITAAAINMFFRFFNFIRKYFVVIEVVGGILLILIGILIMTGELEKISSFLTF
ncbi:MAG: cytochrome c biogenesis protein CcdA [Hydrogenothermaceae bacterium]|nr:cytochrome c biogenesis protein CcdA [Hydrogenothermaceae bacterium]